MENIALRLFESIFLISVGFVAVVMALWQKRRAESTDKELIESPFHEGVYYTHEAARRGVVGTMITAVVLFLLGIVALLI